jgi:hypothetical protein
MATAIAVATLARIAAMVVSHPMLHANNVKGVMNVYRNVWILAKQGKSILTVPRLTTSALCKTRSQQQAQQQSRVERPTIQRLERTESVERAQPLERPQIQEVERRETPRVEQVDRSERFDRPQRIERGGGEERQSGGRTEMRGGRER